jgi:hypothetical protein
VKKLLLTILFFLISGHAYALVCGTGGGCWEVSGGNGNWSSSTNWASSSGGVSGLGPPSASDAVTFDTYSGNMALDSATADLATSVTMTGYPSTLTLTGGDNLIVSGGTVTLGGTITGTGTLKITGTETLIFGAITWPGAVNFDTAGTVTLNNGGVTSNVTGLTTFTLTTVLNKTITGDTWNANGGLTMVTNGSASSTATIILGGGTWTGNFSVYQPLTIAGNITLGTNVAYQQGTITYSSGTVTATGSTLTLNGACTLTTNGMTWNTIAFPSLYNFTVTLGSALNMVNLNGGYGSIITFAGAYPITAGTWYISADVNDPSTWKFVAGQTLNITQGFNLKATTGPSFSPGALLTVQSATASSPTYINYTGPASNENIDGVTFIDVYASALPIPGFGPKLLNLYGGTLTRTQGIVNVTSANINKRPVNYFTGV